MSKKEYSGVLKEFLAMPVNSADTVLEKFAALKGAVKKGEGITGFVYVPGKRKNRALLIAHADTFWDDEWKRQGYNIFINGPGTGDGSFGRAGCAMLWQLRNSGHSLLVLNGSEHGNLGAGFLAEQNAGLLEEINSKHQFALEFGFKEHEWFMCSGKGTPKFEEFIGSRFGLYSLMQMFYSGNSLWRGSAITVLCREICGAKISTATYNMHRSDEYTDEKKWLEIVGKAEKLLKEKDLPKFLISDYEEILTDQVEHHSYLSRGLIFDGAPESEANVFVLNTKIGYVMPDKLEKIFMEKGFTLLRRVCLFTRAGEFASLCNLPREELINKEEEEEIVELFKRSVNRIYFAYGDVPEGAEKLVKDRVKELTDKIKQIRPDMEYFCFGELTEKRNPKRLEDLQPEDEEVRFEI